MIFRSKRAGLVAVLLAAGAALPAAGCESCKKKPEVKATKEPAPPKPTIAEVAMPADCLVDIALKDPEATSKKVVDGAGLTKELGPSPYEKLLELVTDENAKKGVRAVDPHGNIAIVVIGKVELGVKPHGVAALRLKDPDLAGNVLGTVSKGDSAKAQKSEKLGVDVHDVGGGVLLAVYGDVVLASDDRAALESAGKYVAWRANGAKLEHDITIRLPLDLHGGALKKLGNDGWAKVKPTEVGGAKLKAELDALVAPVLDAVESMGMFVVDLDVKGDQLHVEQKLAAKSGGVFSSWLAKYPVGDAAPMLSMPRADGVSYYRLPPGLGPLIYTGAEHGFGAMALPAADTAEAVKGMRALGGAMGHGVALSNKSGTTPGSLKGFEYLARIDLDDPVAAKAGVASIRKLVDKLTTKPTVAPYKKFGAEGEVFTVSGSSPGLSMFGGAGAGATTDSLFYAIKDKGLFLGVCFDCKPSLPDVAFDPASKGLVDGDADAKKKIGEYPGKGLVGASYGSVSLLPFLGAASPKAGGTPGWGYTTVSADGLVGKGGMSLASLGDAARGYLMMIMPPPVY